MKIYDEIIEDIKELATEFGTCGRCTEISPYPDKNCCVAFTTIAPYLVIAECEDLEIPLPETDNVGLYPIVYWPTIQFPFDKEDK